MRSMAGVRRFRSYGGWASARSRRIDYERYALKTIRGDFAHLPHHANPPEESARELMQAVEA